MTVATPGSDSSGTVGPGFNTSWVSVSLRNAQNANGKQKCHDKTAKGRTTQAFPLPWKHTSVIVTRPRRDRSIPEDRSQNTSVDVSASFGNSTSATGRSIISHNSIVRGRRRGLASDPSPFRHTCKTWRIVVLQDRGWSAVVDDRRHNGRSSVETRNRTNIAIWRKPSWNQPVRMSFPSEGETHSNTQRSVFISLFQLVPEEAPRPC